MHRFDLLWSKLIGERLRCLKMYDKQYIKQSDPIIIQIFFKINK